MRLVCFPYAGGAPHVYREWSAALPEVEVWVAHLPGRGARWQETPFTRMLPLVQTLTREFAGLLGTWRKPYAFFGHSLGARLVFEMTRALRRQKRPLPVHLIVSACGAPQVSSGREPVHALPREALIAELRRRNGTPQEVLAHKELLDLLLPTVRADFAVFETAVYHSEAPLEIPITAFGGVGDPLVTHDALVAWEEQTRCAFRRQLFPGDHFFLQTAQTEVVTAVRQQLFSSTHSA